jgi:hypothetical protein
MPKSQRDTSSSSVVEPRGGRRDFLRRSAATALALTGAPLWAVPLDEAETSKKRGSTETAAKPESIVKLLFESLDEKQKKQMCFAWDYVDKKRGLLRARLENNWKITKPNIQSGFYTRDQQAMIRSIFDGITNPDWHKRWDRQLKDDVGGFGRRQSIAIFGEPGSGKFEFVLASRHMTLRCDGDSADHVAFGGPILYAHSGERHYEKKHHPSNVFWHQALEANRLYTTLDGKQQQKALVLKGMPTEEKVAFRGPKGEFHGIPVADLSPDQKGELQRILKMMLDPFRKADRDEALKCLDVQGGLDKCHLAFFKEGDLGRDDVWDNWRLEGPAFVWYFRGKPHVHVWVNVASTPKVVLNSFQNSLL